MFGVEVNRKKVWLLHSGLSDADCCKVHELLCVKYHYIHLAMLSSDEVEFVLETIIVY